ncbi:titin [Modestobacter roseus]|uniref:Titin n=1 Tax=Modestobacter roseus TaxID=1181884 RepID=A0A562IXW6_9ACTN|nr:titin [Modestobacter roseus]
MGTVQRVGRRPGRRALACALGVTATLGGLLAAPAAQAASFDVEWQDTEGSPVTWSVPAGVCELSWTVEGGAGGPGDDGDGGDVPGGAGGWVIGRMAVIPGQQFVVQVGARGSSAGAGGAGGMSGGEPSGGSTAGSDGGGGGGGASIVWSGASRTGTPLIVAGGGGGGGASWTAAGGDAGPTGGDGAADSGNSVGYSIPGGGGGSNATAGAGAVAPDGGPIDGGGHYAWGENGTSGSTLLGGAGARAAGGGGGGWQGGGGGASNRYNSNSTQSGSGGGAGANGVGAGLQDVLSGRGPTSRGGRIGADFSACVTPPVPVLDSAAPAGGGKVRLAFRPGPANGVTTQGYEYTIDGGASWTTLATAPGAAGALTAEVGGLTDGNSYTFAVRATAVAERSAASNSRSVTLVSAPGAVRDLTAKAERASVLVSWQPPTSGGAVDHYEVTLLPSGQAISTTQLSARFGAVAGQSYTATVVAVSAARTAGPAGSATTQAEAASPVVPATVPEAPLTLTTDKGQISSTTPGAKLTVIGTGFLPFSTATIVIYSEPQVLGTVTTDADGNFSREVEVPATLAAGQHSLVASGTAPDGTERFMRMDVTVAAGAAGTPAGGGLAYTGASVAAPLGLGLVTLVGGGVLLLVSRRRRTA